MNTEKLREEALALPANERAHLAHDLLHSLEDPPGPDSDSAWLAEIEKRARELANGTVMPVDWVEARERIRRRLRERRG